MRWHRGVGFVRGVDPFYFFVPDPHLLLQRYLTGGCRTGHPTDYCIGHAKFQIWNFLPILYFNNFNLDKRKPPIGNQSFSEILCGGEAMHKQNDLPLFTGAANIMHDSRNRDIITVKRDP